MFLQSMLTVPAYLLILKLAKICFNGGKNT